MNSVARTIAKIAFSQQSEPASRGWNALRSFATSTASKRYTKSKRTADSNPSGAKEWPRPSEIPYQPKVANSVSLSGYIHMPVQFEAASDGKFWAGTVISLKPSSDSPPLWIPIIFQGDLAHIAACHLKENDHIYIDGQLTSDSPSSDETRPQANVQVMVRNVNFVDGSIPRTKKSTESHTQEGATTHSASTKKASETAMDPWRDLLDNPTKWMDCREKKHNGLVKPKYPDFKRIDDGHPLWLNSAPTSVLSELELKLDVPVQKSKQANQQKGDESWNDLVENPNKWWDNRLDKLNGKVHKKYPDFKNKETGEALWLSRSPAWMKSKLPSLNSKNSPDVSREVEWNLKL